MDGQGRVGPGRITARPGRVHRRAAPADGRGAGTGAGRTGTFRPRPASAALTLATVGRQDRGVSTASSSVSLVPGTAGAWPGVAAGSALLVLGGVLTAASFAQPADSGAGSFLLTLSGLFLAAGAFVANANIQRLRARRVAAAFGRHEWAGVCVDSARRWRLLVLVATADGLRLLSMRRRVLATMDYTALTEVYPTSVRLGAVRSAGLYLAGAASAPLLLCFPSNLGVGFSGRSVDEVAELVSPRLRGARGR